MNLTLIRSSPIALSGYVHIVFEKRQLCSESVPNPISWDRSDIYESKDCCSNCVRRLVKLLDMKNATETAILKVIRGDFDDYQPNRFWQRHGVTVW